MPPRTPDGPPPPPVVQRLWVRYAKRGRLRFSSHRDFQRALERAVRRAGVPIAFSAGFSPHPKISFANAAPTGMASEAEYLEIGVVERQDPEAVRAALDSALPPDLDVVEVVEAPDRESGEPTLIDRLEASVWEIRLPGASMEEVAATVASFLAAGEVQVQRLTKNGMRSFDARTAVVVLEAKPVESGVLLRAVLRHTTPVVRADDLLTGLRSVGGIGPGTAPLITRLAQGRVEGTDGVADPFAGVGVLP